MLLSITLSTGVFAVQLVQRLMLSNCCRPVNNSRERYSFSFDGILTPEAKQDEVWVSHSHTESLCGILKLSLLTRMHAAGFRAGCSASCCQHTGWLQWYGVRIWADWIRQDVHHHGWCRTLCRQRCDPSHHLQHLQGAEQQNWLPIPGETCMHTDGM